MTGHTPADSSYDMPDTPRDLAGQLQPSLDPDAEPKAPPSDADNNDSPPDEPATSADPYASVAASDAAPINPDVTGADPYATTPDPYEGAVPPGYDWPTHGGYLGCLLGGTAACAISGFLGGTWFAILAAPSWVKLLITLVVAVAAFVGLGRLGWYLGKRFYREYPQPVRGMVAAPLTGDALRDSPRDESTPRD